MSYQPDKVLYETLRDDPRITNPGMKDVATLLARGKLVETPDTRQAITDLIFFPDDVVDATDFSYMAGAHRAAEYPEIGDAILGAMNIKARAYIMSGGSTLVDMLDADPIATEARLMTDYAIMRDAAPEFVVDGPAWLVNPNRYQDVRPADQLPEEAKKPENADELLSEAQNTVAGLLAAGEPFLVLENQAMHTRMNFDKTLQLVPQIAEYRNFHIMTSREHRRRAEMTFRACLPEGMRDEMNVTFSSYETPHSLEWDKSFTEELDLVDDHGAVLGEVARWVEYGVKGDLYWGENAPKILQLVERAAEVARSEDHLSDTHLDLADYGDALLMRCREAAGLTDEPAPARATPAASQEGPAPKA